ncbi:MAG: hypothetical protein ACPG85_01985 [Flavobacteriales bacterium]
MLFNWGKKKLKCDEVARMFVHATLDSVEDTWPDVAGLIRESPHFETAPDVEEGDAAPFLLVVLAGNFDFIPKYFEGGSEHRLIEAILAELSQELGLPSDQLATRIGKVRGEMVKFNRPSKKTLSAMARGVYLAYDLNACQEEYFRSLNVPNPRFLMQMEELLQHFIWDWKSFQEQYKMQLETVGGLSL